MAFFRAMRRVKIFLVVETMHVERSATLAHVENVTCCRKMLKHVIVVKQIY
jgi:hypothetical protein